MQKNQIDSVTLILAALAGALAVLQISGPFAWMSSIGGLVLLLVLLSFDQEGYRTVFQSFAFSAVCAFCAAIASGIVFQLLSNQGEVHLANGRWATEYLPLTWAFATAIFWAIDLMRINARKVAPVRVPRALGDTSVLAVPPSFSPEPAKVVRPTPAPVAPAPVEQSVYPPAPSAHQPLPTSFETSASPEAPSQREFSTATSIFAIPETVTPPEAAPVQPKTEPAATPSGKETLIYVSLLGEGLNVLRSVRAESLGRDYFRIIDDMPEGENWQFQPGQVVRCKKKSLSSGKAMVAMEEAPRAL